MKDLFAQNVALYSGKQKEDLYLTPGWPSAALCWIRYHQSDSIGSYRETQLNQKLRIWYLHPHCHNDPPLVSSSHTTNYCQDSSPLQHNGDFLEGEEHGVSRKYRVCLHDNDSNTNNIITNIHNDVVFRSCLSK